MNNLPSLFDRTFSQGPLKEMKHLQRQMDRLFNQFSNNGLPDLASDFIPTPAFAPTCDVNETETHYLLSFDLPGVKKDEINVDVQGNTLTVSGERKEERAENKKGNFLSERFYGSFERSFTLPTEVNADQIVANYADGVLSLALPKTEPTPRKQIKIAEDKSGFMEKFLSHKKEETKKH